MFHKKHVCLGTQFSLPDPLCLFADRVQRQEREVMLKLKEVVDKQRDELRAKVQEITTISKEVEAVRNIDDNYSAYVIIHAHRQDNMIDETADSSWWSLGLLA